MSNLEPEHRTTVVNAGREGGGGAGWFIVGGIVVLALVAIWLFSGGMFDRTTTAGIDSPDNVRIEVPGVDVDVQPAAPAPAQPAAPADTAPAAPAPAAPAPSE